MEQVSTGAIPNVSAMAPVSPVHVAATDATANQRAVTQAVVTAVRKVNDSGYLGDGKEITFSFDRASRQPVIKIVDSQSGEVIDQWPSDYLLQIAAENSTDVRNSA